MIGIAAGVVCYCAIQLKNRLKWDDALDVWGVHGVGGLLGIVLLGVFASTAINPAGGERPDPRHAARSSASRSRPGSAARSTPSRFTYVMLKAIDLITPVRVGEEAETRPRRGHARRDRLRALALAGWHKPRSPVFGTAQDGAAMRP